jgi:hypothetical protein
MAGVMAWLRSWQAVNLDKQGIPAIYVDEDPLVPDDFPDADPDI